MATADAIAAFGDTLVKLLQNGLSGLVGSTNIFLSTPSEFKNFAPNEPSVTVFLYNVGVIAEFRNVPRRTTAGTTQQPSLPLKLHFLITPWAPVARDSYAIAGAILALLFEHPVISGGELLGRPGTWAPDDRVEIIFENLPVEDHCDIWDSADVPYRLSLTYAVRGISIDSAF